MPPLVTVLVFGFYPKPTATIQLPFPGPSMPVHLIIFIQFQTGSMKFHGFPDWIMDHLGSKQIASREIPCKHPDKNITLRGDSSTSHSMVSMPDPYIEVLKRRYGHPANAEANDHPF